MDNEILSLSQHYTHHPDFVRDIQEKLAETLRKSPYNLNVDQGNYQKIRRTLCNFFTGENFFIIAGTGVELKSSSRDAHDNDLFVEVSKKSGKLYDLCVSNRIKDIQGLLEILEEDNSSSS